jgi:CrcB protein
MSKIVYIGLGGFLGASSRYLISKWVEMKWENVFPSGTLVVNTLGSFLLGFLMVIFIEKTANYTNLKIILTTGFLGAFTTFSTFSFETMMLLEDQSFLIAGLNVITNLFLGLLAVMLGIFIARTL